MTIQVYWKDKFDGALVNVDEAAFDPSIHRRAADGPWESTANIFIKPQTDPIETVEEIVTIPEPEPVAAKRGRPSRK